MIPKLKLKCPSAVSPLWGTDAGIVPCFQDFCTLMSQIYSTYIQDLHSAQINMILLMPNGP
jgi:hypothetical protein